MTWQSIERFDIDNPIWVLKYTLWADRHSGEWVKNPDDDAVAHTFCHGWYETEAEARAVLRHFRNYDDYEIEKVHQRKLKDEPC